ncbi:hypothetical protein J6590_107984, partial [Homalodisca vitripennis]
GQGKERQRKFRKQLVKGLVGNVRNSKKRGRPSDMQDDERLNGKLHILELLPYPKDCCVCSDRGVGGTRKRTPLWNGGHKTTGEGLPSVDGEVVVHTDTYTVQPRRRVELQAKVEDLKRITWIYTGLI